MSGCDRLGDGPRRLQARPSAKSPVKAAFEASARAWLEAARAGFLRAERRRSRTYPAWGCQTSPVFKPQRGGHRYRRGQRLPVGHATQLGSGNRCSIRGSLNGSQARIAVPAAVLAELEPTRGARDHDWGWQLGELLGTLGPSRSARSGSSPRRAEPDEIFEPLRKKKGDRGARQTRRPNRR
jgi:hypothetical protein